MSIFNKECQVAYKKASVFEANANLGQNPLTDERKRDSIESFIILRQKT